ncbi:MAG: MliC family protein [Rhodanobacter sp.]
MMLRRALLIAPVLLFAGCQTPAPDATAKAITYTCDDGRTVQAVYPDTETAVIILDGQTLRLHIAVSADGARYVGNRWQWWTKGMHDARLAPLKPGDAIAAASGVSCHAP